MQESGHSNCKNVVEHAAPVEAPLTSSAHENTHPSSTTSHHPEDTSEQQQSQQSPSNPINHKTPCKFYQQIGTCKYGFNCRYSHGFPQGPLNVTGGLPPFARHHKSSASQRLYRQTHRSPPNVQNPQYSFHRSTASSGAPSSQQKPKKNIMQRLRHLLMAHAYQSIRRPINPDDKQDIATHRITKAPDLVNMMLLLEPDVWKVMIQICDNSKIRSEVESQMREAAQRAETEQPIKRTNKKLVRNLEPGLSFDDESKVQMIIQVQVGCDEHVNLVPATIGDFAALGFVKKTESNDSTGGTDKQRSYYTNRTYNREQHLQKRDYQASSHHDPNVEDWTAAQDHTNSPQQQHQQESVPQQPRKPNYADVAAGLASVE